MIVFGSLATGEVHERSDLDIALDGDPDAAEAARGEVFYAAGLEGVDTDIVVLRDAPSGLRERIARDGRSVGALG